MANFACEQCERTYMHRRNLVQHVRRNHPRCDQSERSLARSSKMHKQTCDQCGRTYMQRRSLDCHLRRNHTAHPAFSCINQCENSFTRSGNLEMHKRTCTGPVVV